MVNLSIWLVFTVLIRIKSIIATLFARRRRCGFSIKFGYSNAPNSPALHFPDTIRLNMVGQCGSRFLFATFTDSNKNVYYFWWKLRFNDTQRHKHYTSYRSIRAHWLTDWVLPLAERSRVLRDWLALTSLSHSLALFSPYECRADRHALHVFVLWLVGNIRKHRHSNTTVQSRVSVSMRCTTDTKNIP